ncbi:MAG: hypothetical protein V1726_05510 [Methanobacteriota archaeon]
MQRKTLKKIGVLALLLVLVTSIFTIVAIAHPDNDGDPDDYGCSPVGMKNSNGNPLGKPVYKGTVRDLDFE